MNKKHLLLGTFFSLGLIYSTQANAYIHHTGIVGFSFDVGSAAGRILSSAVKLFLGDDTKLEADLVWDKSGEKGGEPSGCGGCYKNKGQDAQNPQLDPKLVFSDITVEDDIYREGDTLGVDAQKTSEFYDKLKTTCVAYWAQRRVDENVVDQSSLDELNRRAWTIQYHSQRRSIQALTDALNMKRLYATIKGAASSISDDYSDYSKAMSTVASKRLLLDQLLALKKRVVAARVRVRAQTLELNSIDMKLVATAPDLTMICEQKGGAQ